MGKGKLVPTIIALGRLIFEFMEVARRIFGGLNRSRVHDIWVSFLTHMLNEFCYTGLRFSSGLASCCRFMSPFSPSECHTYKKVEA